MLYVHLGDVGQGDAFFGRFDPQARAISDPDKLLYRAFGLERGSLQSLLGPRVWASAAKSALKGHGIGRPVGDTLMMPGLCAVHERRVVWRQCLDHVGEELRLAELEEFASLLPASEGRSA